MSNQLTMTEISYGIKSPVDLLEKLILDGKKINQAPHKYDLFNFFITAASLYEWTAKHYISHAAVRSVVEAVKNRDAELLPIESKTWLINMSCMPNRHCDVRRHVFNAMQVCWQTASEQALPLAENYPSSGD